MSDEDVQAVLESLKSGIPYWELKSTVRQEASKRTHKDRGTREVAIDFLRETGLEVAIKNAVVHYVDRQRSPVEAPNGAKTPELDFIAATQNRWWQKTLKRLNVLASQHGVPFASKRSAETRKLKNEPFFDSLKSHPFTLAMFVYDNKDILREVAALKNPNFVGDRQAKSRQDGIPRLQPWGTVKIQLTPLSLSALRIKFHSLGATVPQIGVDDEAGKGADSFLDARVILGRKVVQGGSILRAREYCCCGCPNFVRGDMWQLAMCGQTESYNLYYDQLKAEVKRYELLSDKLIIADVDYLSSFDDNYFVFQDELREILLCFSRDTELPDIWPAPRPQMITAVFSDSAKESTVYPPNGVIPFRGLSFLCAPFCYTFKEHGQLYSVFRQVYVKYFSRLHTISSHPYSILNLSLLFETLMQRHHPKLLLHIRDIGADPLKVALPWMVTAFSGYLEVDQVLHLWDRVVGFDTPEILSVLAAAIFAYRQTTLLAARNANDMEVIMVDLRGIKIIPLLQYALFG